MDAAFAELSRSQALFVLLVLFVAGLRLVELSMARRNEREARARGGIEVGAGHYPVMVVLHVLFLAGALAEVIFLETPVAPALAYSMLGVLLLASLLRAWVIRTLAWRWTTRVIVVPGLPAIRRGPFRLMRHPNYLAVALEIVALPLVHGAWRSALVFSALNAALMVVRIRSEERALAEHGAYREIFDLEHSEKTDERCDTGTL